MHMKLEFEDESRAVVVFGENATNRTGAMMVTSRSGSDTCQVAVLESTPMTGTLRPDHSIVDPTDIDAIAMVSTVLPPEAGFIFDGVKLSDIRYLYVSVVGHVCIDLSFVPNRIPVDIGRPGGRI